MMRAESIGHRFSRGLVIAGLALVLGAMSAAGALAGQGTATASAQAVHEANRDTSFIAGLGTGTIALLKRTDLGSAEKGRAIERMVDRHFDLAFIGRFSLGRHWRTATPSQKTAYQKAFRAYVMRTYAYRLTAYSGETFAVVGSRVSGSRDSIVRTHIARPAGPALAVDWRVRKTRAGLRVIDVVVEGISMAVTHRQEFAAIVQRRGIDALIATLGSKAAEPRKVASLPAAN